LIVRHVFAALLFAASGAHAQLQAPNVVPVSPRLVTSGQPSAAALAGLRAEGFAAVLYLAPPTVADAVRDEPAILEQQGVDYVNVPIRFEHPTAADFEAVRATLDRWADRKVLVHCQINLRASTMVFLYRVLVQGARPEDAYQAVAGVWTPKGPWKDLVVTLLARSGIAFEPY
jgi:protein tyrosine phosphatase (PTP) superfamily phosphohydrolase (DUF442 family)